MIARTSPMLSGIIPEFNLMALVWWIFTEEPGLMNKHPLNYFVGKKQKILVFSRLSRGFP